MYPCHGLHGPDGVWAKDKWDWVDWYGACTYSITTTPKGQYPSKPKAEEAVKKTTDSLEECCIVHLFFVILLENDVGLILSRVLIIPQHSFILALAKILKGLLKLKSHNIICWWFIDLILRWEDNPRRHGGDSADRGLRPMRVMCNRTSNLSTFEMLTGWPERTPGDLCLKGKELYVRGDRLLMYCKTLSQSLPRSNCDDDLQLQQAPMSMSKTSLCHEPYKQKHKSETLVY